MIRKGLFISILFVLLFSIKIYGSQINNSDISEIVVDKEWKSQQETSGRLVFLFSDSSLNFKHEGNVILFKTAATVSAPIAGNVYALFSEIYFNEGGRIEGKIYSFSSLIESAGEIAAKITPVGFWEKRAHETEAIDNKYIYDSRLPAFAFLILFCLFRQVFCLMAYGAKPGFFNQGSVLFEFDGQDIIQFGLLAYALAIAAALVFLLSIVGFLFTVLILLAAFGLSMFGQISLELTIGNLILNKLKIKTGPYKSIVLGGIIYEATVFIPVLNFSSNFLFLPILCLGIFATNLINGIYRKKYYETPFDYEDKSTAFNDDNKENIRQIITGK